MARMLSCQKWYLSAPFSGTKYASRFSTLRRYTLPQFRADIALSLSLSCQQWESFVHFRKFRRASSQPVGFQLYVTLTTEEILLEVEKSTKIIWYYLLTYGLSFSIVAIALAIDPGAYTQSDFGVWMEPTGLFYCTFVTPVLIFVLVSAVFIRFMDSF